MSSLNHPDTFANTRHYPFDGYEYLATSELSEVERAISNVFEPRHYLCKGKGEVRGSIVRLPYLDVGGAYFGGNIQERFPNPSENYFLLAPQSGVITTNHSQLEVKPLESALVISPGEMVDLSWKNCSVVVVRIRPEVIHNFAEKFYDNTTCRKLQLPSLLNMQKATGLSIANILRTMSTEIEDDESLLSRGITGRAINEMLLTALLHTNQRVETALGGTIDSKLKVAVDYVMANLKKEIAITDLSHVAGVSARKLQSDFSRQYGMGPMSFIKHERLKRVRGELVKAHPDDVSVADIASHWGFYNPSHFTQLYKKQFGEKPSETLLNQK